MTPKRWVLALAVVDGLLAIVLVVMIMLAVGSTPGGVSTPEPDGTLSSTPTSSLPTDGGPSGPTTDPGTEPAQEPTLQPPPDGARELGAFALPSRNIACTLEDAAVTCTIANAEFTPPPGDGCEWRGQVVVLAEDGVVMPCPDGPSQAAGDDALVLEYGQAATLGTWACESSERGVECWSLADGTGFTLARASFTSYGPGRLG